MRKNNVRKVLYNEISLMVGGVALVSTMLFWIINPQQATDIQITKLQAQIESNAQVGVLLQQFKDNDLHELQLKMNRIEERQIRSLEAIARIEALIGVR